LVWQEPQSAATDWTDARPDRGSHRPRLNFQRQFDAIQAAQIAKIYVQHPNHGGLVMSMTQRESGA
jgi:hypothetical protein